MYVYAYVYSKYSNIYSKITVLCLFLEVDSTWGSLPGLSKACLRGFAHTGMSMGNYGCSSKSKQCHPIRGPQYLSSWR